MTRSQTSWTLHRCDAKTTGRTGRPYLSALPVHLLMPSSLSPHPNRSSEDIPPSSTGHCSLLPPLTSLFTVPEGRAARRLKSVKEEMMRRLQEGDTMSQKTSRCIFIQWIARSVCLTDQVAPSAEPDIGHASSLYKEALKTRLSSH